MMQRCRCGRALPRQARMDAGCALGVRAAPVRRPGGCSGTLIAGLELHDAHVRDRIGLGLVYPNLLHRLPGRGC